MKSGTNTSISLLLHSLGLFLAPILLVIDISFTNIELITYLPLFISPVFIAAMAVSFLPGDKIAFYPKWLYIFNVILGLLFAGCLFPMIGLWLLLNQGFASLMSNTQDNILTTGLLIATGFLVGISIYLNIIHARRTNRQNKSV